jgi:hypothetical protein
MSTRTRKSKRPGEISEPRKPRSTASKVKALPKAAPKEQASATPTPPQAQPLPAPNEPERAEIAKAAKRVKERKPRFNVQITGEGEAWSVGNPHNDHEGWLDRMLDVFGTRSGEFALTNLQSLSNIVRGKDPQSSRDPVNAALASVEAIGPKDELEAMLAVQMAATHAMQMRILLRMKNTETLNVFEAYSNAANKLARTFTAQVDALAKLRRGGEQTVRVEHVHVYPGGKAVVGTVNNNHPSPGARGANENCEQPHATNYGSSEAVRTVTYAPGVPLPALFSEDAERLPLPLANGQGQEPMPDARRS